MVRDGLIDLSYHTPCHLVTSMQVLIYPAVPSLAPVDGLPVGGKDTSGSER